MKSTLYTLYWAGEGPEAVNALVGLDREVLEGALALYRKGKLQEAAELLSESVPRVWLFPWEDLEPLALTLAPNPLLLEEKLPEGLLEKGKPTAAAPLSLVLPSPQEVLTLLVTLYPAGGMAPPFSFTLFVPQELEGRRGRKDATNVSTGGLP